MYEQLLLEFAASKFCSHKRRLQIYKSLGLQTEFAFIERGLQFNNPDLSKILIGKNCYINEFCYIENNAEILIGDRVAIAMHCRLITSTHPIGSPEKRAKILDRKPIKIGSGSWIGAGVTILPGVRIGQGCVVAAGSLVSKNCDANCLYTGVPARKVRELVEAGN